MHLSLNAYLALRHVNGCSLKHIQKRYLALARLAYPVNLGRSNEGTQIILLVISPQKEKKTKSDIELGRTFATILSDLEFRRQLIFAQNEEEVKALLCARAHELEEKQAQLRIDDIIDDCFESRVSERNCPSNVQSASIRSSLGVLQELESGYNVKFKTG
ncbi:hypothetical protein ACTXT7_010470 [Hymenolepis weldensis]